MLALIEKVVYSVMEQLVHDNTSELCGEMYQPRVTLRCQYELTSISLSSHSNIWKKLPTFATRPVSLSYVLGYNFVSDFEGSRHLMGVTEHLISRSHMKSMFAWDIPSAFGAWEREGGGL
jgi:hypothetical protein